MVHSCFSKIFSHLKKSLLILLTLKMCACVKVIKIYKGYKIVMTPFCWKVLENQHRNGSPGSLVNFVDLRTQLTEVHYIRHDVVVNEYPMFFFLCNNWTHYLAIHNLYFLELQKASKQGWGENKYQIITIYYFQLSQVVERPHCNLVMAYLFQFDHID